MSDNLCALLLHFLLYNYATVYILCGVIYFTFIISFHFLCYWICFDAVQLDNANVIRIINLLNNLILLVFSLSLSLSFIYGWQFNHGGFQSICRCWFSLSRCHRTQQQQHRGTTNWLGEKLVKNSNSCARCNKLICSYIYLLTSFVSLLREIG